MSKDYCPDIESKYSLYTQLLEEQKTILDKIIEINKVGNNNTILEELRELKHITVRHYLCLITNVSKKNQSSFKFKMRCVALSGMPFFRYDSAGGTHRNYDGNYPLSGQQVPTPHFQKFTDKGICIAYQTDKLKNAKEAKALEDINLSLAHFCDEAKITLNESEYPEVKITYDLGIPILETDPLKNIDFKQ